MPELGSSSFCWKKLGLNTGTREILAGLGTSEHDNHSSSLARARRIWAHCTSTSRNHCSVVTNTVHRYNCDEYDKILIHFFNPGIVWFRWRGWDYTLKRSRMMIRPKNFFSAEEKEIEN